MGAGQWSWINGDYVFVPEWIAKGGRAKVVRIPKTVRNRLEKIRVPGEDFVFIRFPQEVKEVSGRDTLAYTPDRLIGRMVKLVKDAAIAIGKPDGLSHHALRRTVMELSDEGELMDKEKESARKLQTTPLNKRINYTKRGGKKRVILANGLFENLTVALQDYPSLVARLGCDILAEGLVEDLKAGYRRLPPLQKEQFRNWLDKDDSEGAGAVVA